MTSTIATGTIEADPALMAEAAGLRYVSTDEPGFRRRRCGRGFTYVGPVGTTVPAAERARIESLVIPPAWTDVWICRHADGHLQAVGLDDRDRRQYLYHPRWRTFRDELKFELLGDFATGLPDLRRRVADDLTRPGHDRRRVTAAVIRLLDRTLVRIGNDRYAADNETFGATTLEPRHATRRPDGYRLEFTGKSNVERVLDVTDPDVAEVIGACLEQPQPQLFWFDDGDGPTDLHAGHVNGYLAQHAPTGVTAKTFRTWGATALAVEHLATTDDATPERRALGAIDVAAAALGNTRAVCRSCYVAPLVIDAVESGALADAWTRSRSGRWRSRPENATLKLLLS